MKYDNPVAPKQFVLTEEHLLLMRNFCIGWQDAETGAPEVDPKRPYGNSGVGQDVCEILGWQPECRNDHDGETWFSDKQIEAALDIHRQTEWALQILLKHGPKAGTYKRTDTWLDDWEPV